MCKLSLNIVPNVYDSLKNSFLSLAWPWPGRSLPKGNQWEWWDPGQGPNVVRFPVHLSPQCTLNILYTPSHPYTPTSPLYPCWPLTSTLPASPQCTPDTSYTPWQPPNSPTPTDTPVHPCQCEYWDHGLGSNVVGLIVHLPPQCPLQIPTAPWFPLHPCWSPDTLLPCWWECCDPVVGLPVHMPPQCLLHPACPSDRSWDPGLGPSLPVHLPPQCPYTPTAPLCPYTPAGPWHPQSRHLVANSSPTSGHLDIWPAFGSDWPASG